MLFIRPYKKHISCLPMALSAVLCVHKCCVLKVKFDIHFITSKLYVLSSNKFLRPCVINIARFICMSVYFIYMYTLYICVYEWWYRRVRIRTFLPSLAFRLPAASFGDNFAVQTCKHFQTFLLSMIYARVAAFEIKLLIWLQIFFPSYLESSRNFGN